MVWIGLFGFSALTSLLGILCVRYANKRMKECKKMASYWNTQLQNMVKEASSKGGIDALVTPEQRRYAELLRVQYDAPPDAIGQYIRPYVLPEYAATEAEYNAAVEEGSLWYARYMRAWNVAFIAGVVTIIVLPFVATHVIG